jgi:hypothetical protein
MHSVEDHESIYSILALAEQSAAGGFHASVVIRRSIAGRIVEAYRRERLEGSRAFDESDSALRFAIDHGRRIIRSRPSQLAC